MVYMRTTTIRVPVETRDRLNALARKSGTPAGEIVSRLVLEADDDALLAEAEASWTRLAADDQALEAYRAETKELGHFDESLADY
jgi:predicted transcriptional regulator